MPFSQQQLNELWKKDIWFYLREKGAPMFQFLASLIPESCKSILDVGCGEALILPHLSKEKCYVGTDFSNFILEKNLNTYEELICDGRVFFRTENMHHDEYYPFTPVNYDIILMFGLFPTMDSYEILELVSLYKNLFHPAYILIEDLAATDFSLVEKTFHVEKKFLKTFDFISKPIGVGTPEQINNRQILLLKCNYNDKRT